MSDPTASSTDPAPPSPDDFEVIGTIPQCVFGSGGGVPDPNYCAPLLPVGDGEAVWCARCCKIAGIDPDANADEG